MDNTGNDNGELDQHEGNPADEAATPSGWVITKEAPEPADQPARAKAGGGSKARKPTKKKPAPARKKPAAAKRAAGGKKQASAKTARKKTARPAGKKKPARQSGKRKVR